MPRAAAPHSTASIWSSVGVLTRRLGGLPGLGLSLVAGVGSATAVSPDLDAQRLPDARDHVGIGLLVIHDHRGLAQGAAADLLGRPSRRGPLEPVGLVLGIEGEADARLENRAFLRVGLHQAVV